MNEQLFADVELNEETMQKVIAQLVIETSNKQKEIERLVKNINAYDELLMQKNTIIDIAKEYIEKRALSLECALLIDECKELYKILNTEVK